MMAIVSVETRWQVAFSGLDKATTIHEAAKLLRSVAVEIERLGDKVGGDIPVKVETSGYQPFGLIIRRLEDT